VKRASKRSCFTLGILTTPAKDIFHSSYHLGLLSGIQPRVQSLKGHLKIIMMPSRPYQSLDEILKRHKLDGLLILTWRWIHPSIARLIEKTRHSKALVINDPVPGLRVNLIYTDINAGMRQAVAHLVKKGRRKIGMLHGPWEVPFKVGRKEVKVPFIDTQLKVRGFLGALKTRHISCDPSWLRSGTANSESEGYRVMKNWLREKDIPEAIVCGNDDLAFGALKAIRKAGKHVPRDIAVVGFDDNKRAKSFNPPLTTIRQPLRQMGRDAVDILASQVQRIRHPVARPVSKQYLPKLIIRKTA